MPKWQDTTNKGIAELLRRVAAAYEIRGGNRFRVQAYDKAATSIEHATSEVKDLWDDNKLDEIPGVGENIAKYLDELFRKGHVKHFDKLFKSLPPAMFELLNLPGVGPKTAYRLVKELGIEKSKNPLGEIKKAAKKGKISKIADFGERTQQKLFEAVREQEREKKEKKRMNLSYASETAKEILEYFKNCKACKRVDTLGSLRRCAATVGDIDLSVSTRKPQEVIDFFVKYPKIEKVLKKGKEGASVRLNNKCQVDLRVQKPEAYGAMLQHFTGSKQHNIHLRELALEKGFSLSEYGIKETKSQSKRSKLKNFGTEEDFYNFLGLEWIPPELREDKGEIEAAQKGKLPKLVKLSDIKGDLHLHSSFDVESSHDVGKDKIEEMMKKGQELGYEYVGFSEHNPSTSKHRVSKIIAIIKRKKEKIDKINYSRVKKLSIHALNGLEIDIKPDGKLAVPEEALRYLDYAIVAIHTSFSLSRKEMTKRVLAGLSHSKAKIFAHPTGRKINIREAYELNWDKIFDFCLKNKKWLEINAWSDRLDLPDTLVKEAVKKGVKMIINTDAHKLSQMDLMPYGVSVARRGWAEKGDIINTLDYNSFLKALSEGR